MAIQVHVTQASMDASWGLFQKMFPGDERDLPNLVFGTSQPPLPIEFSDPQDPNTQDLAATLIRTITRFVTHVTVNEIQLEARQVSQLDVQDPRIATLKQRILNEIWKIPIVQDLRTHRMQLITQNNIAAQANFDASWRLLQRMFPRDENESRLSTLVYGTDKPPMRAEFSDPQNPFTQTVGSIIVETMTSFVTSVIVHEMYLDVSQVDQLDVQDPRIVTLKQRIYNHIAQIPIVQQLRAERMQLLTRFNNETLLN